VCSPGAGRGAWQTVAVPPYDFRQVSPTALIPAFARAENTGIPWAKETVEFLLTKGLEAPGGSAGEPAIKDYAAFFESRFKAVNAVLAEQKSGQVLELAAGLSPRGMEMSQRGIVYVEADLDDSIALKREVVTAVLGSVPASLQLCPVNVLDAKALRDCCSVFDNSAVAITTEGLLRYLTFDEKKQLGAIVHGILALHGGFWVTTDIHLRQWAMGHRRLVNRKMETERLGRSLDANYFDDLDHARRFFEECGFRVEERPLLEGVRDQVHSLPTAPDELAAELNARRAFILRVA
jgi:O-methyltransferase involved in polyketide biosynthesis